MLGLDTVTLEATVVKHPAPTKQCSFADHLACALAQTSCSGWILGVVTACRAVLPSAYCCSKQWSNRPTDEGN
jgi:hypothetical protein